MASWSRTLNKIKINVFWNVTPCSLVDTYKYLKGICSLRLQDKINFVTYVPNYMTSHHKLKTTSIFTTMRHFIVTNKIKWLPQGSSRANLRIVRLGICIYRLKTHDAEVNCSHLRGSVSLMCIKLQNALTCYCLTKAGADKVLEEINAW
jgi:hypothetical protein